MALLPS